MINYKLNITLHANQKVINANPARYMVAKAGKRFGKTKLALYRLIQRAGRYPGDVFWYLAPSYRQAENIAWLELKKLLPRQLVKREVENKLMVELTCGSILKLVGCDNDEALRGPQLRAVVFDEAAYIKEYVWPSIISGQLMGYGGESFADFISSPNKDGRNWFSSFYDDAVRMQMAGDKEWAAHYYTIYDNPTLTADEIEKRRQNTPDDIWQLEYMAIESEFAGPLYGEFDFSRHVGDVPDTFLPLYRGLDWGIAHPTACIWAKVDLNKKMVYIFDEYMKSGAVISENAETINRITGNRQVEWTVCDPSMAKRNSQTPFTDMIEFARNGIPCIAGDRRDRGIDILKMFLKKGMIKIHPKCKNLIYQFKNLQRGDDENDDMVDACRYLVLRIHDTMQGMNVYENDGKPFERDYTPERLAEIRQLNFNDRNIFPAEINEEKSWIMQEIGGE